MNLQSARSGEVHHPYPTAETREIMGDIPWCRTGGQNIRGTTWVETEAPVTCERCKALATNYAIANAS